MLQKHKMTVKRIIGWGFVVAALFCMVRSIMLSLSIDIWYDELFSIEFAKRPVSELISLTARDVHPPVYYIILRFFLLMGEGIGIVGPGGLEPEMMAKIVSVIPFLLLLIYDLTVIRKHYGIVCAGIFSFAIVSMPQMPEYTTEIRMYSWSVFFVTAMLIHSISLLRKMYDSEFDKWDILNALGMIIYSSAAAYTHYYAAFCVAVIYGFLLLWVIAAYVRTMKKSGKKVNIRTLATVIICINMTAISYIPWISVVLSQVGAVKENYWIQPVGIRTFGSAAKYLFKGYFDNYELAIVLAVIFLFFVAALFIRSLIRLFRNKDVEEGFLIYGFVVLPVIVTMGIAASILIRPVFQTRYMLPGYGCFWLAVSGMASRELDAFLESEDKVTLKRSIPGILSLATVLLVLIVGIQDYKTFIGNEKYRKVKMEETTGLLESIDSDTIIISNFNQVQSLLSYYLNRDSDEIYRVRLYQEEPEPLMKEMIPGLESLYDPIDIKNYLGNGKKVIFFGSFNSREDIVSDWQIGLGITNENQGSYLMERYWIDEFVLK